MQDIQRWIVRLLDRYSSAYASNQCRALQQFFRWLAAEDEVPDPMAGLKPPRVPGKPVPVFTAGDLPRLERACAGRAFEQRRDAALIAVFRATGIRLPELAGIRYDPGDPRRSDIDLWHREVTVHGKGRKTRTVKISHDAARSPGRYLRVRARHAQAYRPQLWLGVGNRGPMTASGIYQVIARRGRQCGIDVFPHRFRHHFSHTWLDRGGLRATLWSSTAGPPRRCSALRRQRPQRQGTPQLRPGHGGRTLTRARQGRRRRDACYAKASGAGQTAACQLAGIPRSARATRWPCYSRRRSARASPGPAGYRADPAGGLDKRRLPGRQRQSGAERERPRRSASVLPGSRGRLPHWSQ